MPYLEPIVKIYLFLFTVYHIITGIVSYFFPNFSKKFYLALYGFHYELSPMIFLIAKPWGALCVSTGIASFFAFLNPAGYKGVIYSLIVLLGLRALYRYRYRYMIKEVVKTKIKRNYINIAIILGGMIILTTWSLALF